MDASTNVAPTRLAEEFWGEQEEVEPSAKQQQRTDPNGTSTFPVRFRRFPFSQSHNLRVPQYATPRPLGVNFHFRHHFGAWSEHQPCHSSSSTLSWVWLLGAWRSG